MHTLNGSRTTRGGSTFVRLIAGMVPALALACSSGITVPSATAFDLTGGWNYRVPLIPVQGIQCTVSPITLQVNQQGGSLSGTHGPAEGECLLPGGGFASFGVPGGQIRNGSLNGTQVRFELSGAGWQHTGEALPNLTAPAHPNLLMGTVSGVLTLAAPVGALSFNSLTWQAVR